MPSPAMRREPSIATSDALRGHPDACRAVAALGLFSLSEHAVWVTILVVAYQRGGVVETGVVSAALLIPAASAAPVAARELSSPRFGNPLAFGYAIQAVALLVVAAVLALELDPVVFYMAGMLATVTTVFSRPTHHAYITGGHAMPAATVATGVVSGAAQLGGPLLASVVLVRFGAVQVMGIGAALLAAACLLVVGVPRPSLRTEPAGAGDGASWPARPAPVRYALHGHPPATQRCVLLLMTLLGAVTVVLGITETLAAEVSFARDGVGGAGTGVLLAAVGAGLLAGAPLAGRLMAGGREHRAMRSGALVSGSALMAIALPLGFAWAIAAFAAVGAGMQIVLVSGWVLLHRYAGGTNTAIVFGFLERQQLIGNGLGALCAGIVVGGVGLWPVVVVVGALLPMSMLAMNADRARRLSSGTEVGAELGTASSSAGVNWS